MRSCFSPRSFFFVLRVTMNAIVGGVCVGGVGAWLNHFGTFNIIHHLKKITTPSQRVRPATHIDHPLGGTYQQL